MSLCWDWETQSPIDIKARGAYVYAEHPLTDALLASYKLKPDDNAATRAWIAAGGEFGKLYRWRRGEPCPPHVRAYIEAGGELSAHNCAFERLIWQKIMTPRHGWPALRLEQCRCTAVTAAAMSLPRDLERLGDALDLKTKKDKRGKALMHIHSIPIGFAADGSPIWHKLVDDPASLDAYHDYCDFDVLSEEEAASRLIPLSDDEMRVYWMSERINDRGLRIDVASARAAIRLAAAAKDALNAEMAVVTGNCVTAVTQVARLKAWCEGRGVVLPSVDKNDVEDFLHEVDDLPDDVRRALELRQEGAKPSVDKISAMLNRVSDDARARGVYLHHGAGQTGRFSSRGVQAHNMPKYRKVFEDANLDPATLFAAIRTEHPGFLRETYGPELGRPLHLLSDAVRGFIWAAPGHEIMVADYGSIEGRLAAWFAGEEWELEAYRALDRGEGAGIYELNAADIYQIPVERVTKAQRKVGKVRALACAYETGAGGIRKFARQEKIKLSPLYAGLWHVTETAAQRYVEGRYKERVAKHDVNCAALGREGWIAAELIKLGWRNKHPRIVETWTALEEAATAAVANPGQRFSVIGCSYLVTHGFLWCKLPSGRCLAYGMPKMQETEAPWADPTLEPILRERKLSLTARGVESQTEKWARFPIYGGSLFNNVVQGTARDILVHGMFKAEERYERVIGHTHDEILVEVPRGSADVGEFEQLICQTPRWTPKLPLVASGFASKRYAKK